MIVDFFINSFDDLYKSLILVMRRVVLDGTLCSVNFSKKSLTFLFLILYRGISAAIKAPHKSSANCEYLTELIVFLINFCVEVAADLAALLSQISIWFALRRWCLTVNIFSDETDLLHILQTKFSQVLKSEYSATSCLNLLEADCFTFGIL